VDPVATVQVELAPDAVGVEAHHPALPPLRPAVDVVEIEIAHVGHLRDPEARGHRVEQDLVVLLVLEDPGRMDVARRSVGLLVVDAYAAQDPAAEPALVEAPERADQLLLEQRRKNIS
jgi:hypothetical protein